MGVDAEQDYLRVPITCGVYGAFPTLGWVDVSGAYPGHAAAPALSLQLALGAPMHLDWGTPAADAVLRMPELLGGEVERLEEDAVLRPSLARSHTGNQLAWPRDCPPGGR